MLKKISFEPFLSAYTAIDKRNIIETQVDVAIILLGLRLMLIYDPHKREIMNQITTRYKKIILMKIISLQRIILSKNKCLEIIAVKGIANRLTALSDALISVKGVLHGKLSMSRAD
jgi:CopG family nickel-responsive transcriptional regulator